MNICFFLGGTPYEYMFFFLGGDTLSKSKYGGAQHRLFFVATDCDQLRPQSTHRGYLAHTPVVGSPRGSLLWDPKSHDFSRLLRLTSPDGLGMTHPPVELGSISKP